MNDQRKRTKPAIVLRVGLPPVVEQIECERITRYRGTPPVDAIKMARVESIVGDMIDLVRPLPSEVAALEQELGVTLSSDAAGFEVKLIVHDEGMVRGMPVNDRATRLYPGRDRWRIHGDCVLVEVD
jgi:hypothetical protein